MASTRRTAPHARRAARLTSSISIRQRKHASRSTAIGRHWRSLHGETPLPKLGLGRFVVVADNDAEAMRLARRAYPVWHQSFTYLFRLQGRAQSHPRPADFDALVARGQGVAGSPATVKEFLSRQLAETGCNYVVGQFAFGDLTLGECLRSIGLFASEVMPALRAVIPGPSVARSPESIATIL